MPSIQAGLANQNYFRGGTSGVIQLMSTLQRYVPAELEYVPAGQEMQTMDEEPPAARDKWYQPRLRAAPSFLSFLV